MFTLYWISLLVRRFVFRLAEASAKRVTGDEPQGTMGRVLSPSRLPLRAHFHQKRDVWVLGRYWIAFAPARKLRGTQRQFLENICSESDLISRIFETVVVKFLACLPLLGFSNTPKMV